MRTVLVLAHATTAAVWLGAMTYSLVVVQPRAARFFASRGDDDYEEFLATLAGGNRWSVLGMMAVVGGTGLALLAFAAPNVVHLAKGLLLVVALAVFWYASWRIWPRRVFALESERPALRRALHRCAYLLTALVGTAFVLGILSAT